MRADEMIATRSVCSFRDLQKWAVTFFEFGTNHNTRTYTYIICLNKTEWCLCRQRVPIIHTRVCMERKRPSFFHWIRVSSIVPFGRCVCMIVCVCV